jgi:hypothetical protein
MKMGPNDVSGIVWALGNFFGFFRGFFFHSNLIVIGVITLLVAHVMLNPCTWRCTRMAEIGPKRRQMRRLGPR